MDEETVDIPIKDFPDDLYEKIQRLAASQNLSVNDWILRAIDDWLKREKEEEKRQKSWYRS